MRYSGARVMTGMTSAQGPSRSPAMMRAIPAPSRTCAQVPMTRGTPVDQAASAMLAARRAAVASWKRMATDSANRACRGHGQDQADTPESG